MLTLDFAKGLVAAIAPLIMRHREPEAVDEAYRLLLLYAEKMKEGYGEPPTTSRGKERQYANRHGFFWLPCLICCNWYGGHEGGRAGIILSEGRGIGVCSSPLCQEEALRINAKWKNGIVNGVTPCQRPTDEPAR